MNVAAKLAGYGPLVGGAVGAALGVGVAGTFTGCSWTSAPATTVHTAVFTATARR